MVKRVTVDPTLRMKITPYEVVGRAIPTANKPEPKIYSMKVFARDEVVAKSRFWYFMKKLNKVKKSAGEILRVKRISEKSCNKIRNYAMWIRYDSRTSTHNMYKEYRDVSQAGAVSQMYAEMTGRHSALHQSIQIMRIAEIPDSEVKRPHIQALTKPGLKFPIVQGPSRINKRYRATFARHGPSTYRH